MMYRFVVDVPLRWVDADSEGVVNNAVYLNLMEHARYLYCEELGLLTAGRVEFLLAEVNVKFQKPGRVGMKTEVAARTSKLGSKSFQMDYEVRAGNDVLARGQAALVWVDADHRPCPIPPRVREAIGTFEGIEAGAD